MNKQEVSKLQHGLYEIFWKEGGHSSLAAIGSLSNGDRWLAPCNWVSVSYDYSSIWRTVERVKLIKAVNYDR